MDSAAVLDFPATLWVVDFANRQPGIVVLALAGPGLCERPIDRAGGWTICVHRALGHSPLAGPAGHSVAGCYKPATSPGLWQEAAPPPGLSHPSASLSDTGRRLFPRQPADIPGPHWPADIPGPAINAAS
jgi:hypothetical protein